MNVCKLDVRHYNCIIDQDELPEELVRQIDIDQFNHFPVGAIIDSIYDCAPILKMADRLYSNLQTFTFIQDAKCFKEYLEDDFEDDFNFFEEDYDENESNQWALNIAFAYGQTSPGAVKSDSMYLIKDYRENCDDTFSKNILAAQLFACFSYFTEQNLEVPTQLSDIIKEITNDVLKTDREILDEIITDSFKELDELAKNLSQLYETKSKTIFHKWFDAISMDDFEKTCRYHKINNKYVIETNNTYVQNMLEEFGFEHSTISSAMLAEHTMY